MSVYSVTPPNYGSDAGKQKNATGWNAILNETDQVAPNVNSGTDGALDIAPNTTLGINTAYVQSAGGAGYSLALGANGTNASVLVLSDATASVNKPLVMNAGGSVPAGQTLTIAGTVNNTGYAYSSQAIVVPNSGAGQAVANPGSAGLWAYTVDYTTAGNTAIQVSGVAYFNGTTWSGGCASSTATNASSPFNPLAQVSPNAGATALQIAQSGGGSVTANFRWYKLLGAHP